MGRITVDFDIEYMSASREGVVRSFHLSLVARRTMVVHRHMVGISIVNLIGNSGNFAERLAILGRELA